MVVGGIAVGAEAVDTDVRGMEVRICSLDHLRTMKAAVGRAQDRADLENLPEHG